MIGGVSNAWTGSGTSVGHDGALRLGSLPEIGDPNTAPNTHVTPTYISRSEEDTGSPNIVTGVIIDYRGFDTMWETSVMFLAGLTTVLILTSNTVGRRPEEEPEDPEEGEIIK